jgi:orotate phosphoribosyltransferase
VAGLNDLLAYIEHHPEFSAHRVAVAAYRTQYGIDA